MVGKKIRAFREFRGYSQIQLAELSGINVGTIRKYELGIRNPKPDQLEKIATALGLNVSVRGGCAPPYRCAAAYTGESAYAGCPAQQPPAETASADRVYCWKNGW